MSMCVRVIVSIPPLCVWFTCASLISMWIGCVFCNPTTLFLTKGRQKKNHPLSYQRRTKKKKKSTQANFNFFSRWGNVNIPYDHNNTALSPWFAVTNGFATIVICRSNWQWWHLWIQCRWDCLLYLHGRQRYYRCHIRRKIKDE